MTMPLRKGATPGPTEQSHGRSRAPHPDSDYQSQRTELPWEVADRAQGAKRGGVTAQMYQEASKRLDATNNGERVEDMLYVNGNPDAFGPDEPIVKEKKRVAPRNYKQPVLRYGVDRQSGLTYGK